MNDIKISKKLLISGIALLVIGFVFMAVGKDAYSIWKLSVSPIIILTAFSLIALSILKPKSSDV